MKDALLLEISLGAPVPDASLDHFRSLMAYCDPRIRALDLSGVGQGFVRLELGEPADRRSLERKVRRVAERVAAGAQTVPAEASRRLAGRGTRWTEGLEKALDEARLTVLLGEGAYALQGLAASLARAFDEDFRALALRLGARDAQFPSLVGLSFLRRIGYFKSFPHYTTFAAHLQPDVEVLDAFMEHAGGGGAMRDARGMAPADAILSPTICYHLYASLQDRAVPAEGLRVTALGRCWRWESSNMAHLRRLWEFAMRELIWVGSKELVAEQRERAVEETLAYCERLGLEAWIENANDPFFSTDAGKRSFYQRGFGMKLELRLPYARDGASLAAASFNNMGRTFGDSCAIRTAAGEPAFSGCAGWGTDRWVYAFLAQHGLDPRDWPEPMRGRA